MLIIYQITWYDVEESQTQHNWGIAAGKTLTDAIKHIVEYYGEDNIIELNVELSFDVLEAEDIDTLKHEKEIKIYDDEI